MQVKVRDIYALLIVIGMVFFYGCDEIIDVFEEEEEADSFAGAVYVMTNETSGNKIATYGRSEDGSLTFTGSYPTGGLGASFDGGEGLDPLISAYALNITEDREFILAVNAGSNTVSIMQVEEDFSLSLTDQVTTNGTGPNSIAIFDEIVYVSNIDEDGSFAGEPDQEGSLIGYSLTEEGKLTLISGSERSLEARPSAVQFSPDGNYLAVSFINGGSAALASGSTDEIVVFEVNADGSLSANPTGNAASTLPGNPENRNLPSAIGFQIVEELGVNYILVTEAREFQADGTPPAFPNLQTGSVSSYRIEADGSLSPVIEDVLAGSSISDGQRTTCWIAVSNEQDYLWVSNALPASISTYAFDGTSGSISLINELEIQGTPAASDTDPDIGFETTEGWIDCFTDEDGRFLYQLYGLDGTIGVFKIDGSTLSLVEEETGTLPSENTQGIVAF